MRYLRFGLYLNILKMHSDIDDHAAGWQSQSTHILLVNAACSRYLKVNYIQSRVLAMQALYKCLGLRIIGKNSNIK